MPDRSADRHDPEKPGRFFRPDPADLWDRLGAAVGVRNRAKMLSTLIGAYLDGKPMPPLPGKAAKAAPAEAKFVAPAPDESQATVVRVGGRDILRPAFNPKPKTSGKPKSGR